MPCFSDGPTPGTPEHAAWLLNVRRKFDAFTHVVDYYYRRAGVAMPQPAALDGARGWDNGEEVPPDAVHPIDPAENKRILDQILLHLDCDDVNFFELHDIGLLLREERTTQARGYQFVRGYCFRALRSGFLERPTSAGLWCACDQPNLMLDHLGESASARKLRLFAVACCRAAPPLLTDERSRAAVDAAEQFADGSLTTAKLAKAETRAKKVGTRDESTQAAAWAANPSANDAARRAAWEAAGDGDGFAVQAALLRDIFGNPFRPVMFAPEWRTSTAIALARRMYESRDFGALPILADALQDAGCDNADVLDHCRAANSPHVRGCWVVDLVLSL